MGKRNKSRNSKPVIMAAEEPKPKADFSEIGKPGLANFSGSIQDDFLREMRGKEAFKRYNEMRLNSPVVGALLLALEQPMRQLSWEFISDEEGEDERIDFLNEARDNMSLSWNDHISEALTMLPFGYSIFEIVYKVMQDGRIGWRKFAPRGQDTVNRWLYDEEGGLSGFEQVSPPNYIPTPLPIEKLIIYRTRVERGNPEGRSILRTAWTPYYFTKHLQQIEAIGAERDLAGLPVITLPSNADRADNETSDLGVARKMVRNIRNDEQAGIVLPSSEWKLELLSTGGSRQFDTDKIIRRYESRILMSALAQFLLLGQDGVGSLALSGDQTDFFSMSINAIADVISETFTKYAIPRLLALNGYDTQGIRMQHTPPGDVDLAKIGSFLQQTGAYINWSAEDEIWLRQVGGMPERSAEDIQADLDKQVAARAAAAEAMKQRLQQGKQDANPQQDDSQDSSQMRAQHFSANAPDARKRAKAEREWERTMSAFFGKQKKRILKAAREMDPANSYGGNFTSDPAINK